jgi:hypothetical protein
LNNLWQILYPDISTFIGGVLQADSRKQLARYYCGELEKHEIVKHLRSCHKAEALVAEMMAISDRHEENIIQTKLLHLENFKHNFKVLSEGKCTII